MRVTTWWATAWVLLAACEAGAPGTSGPVQPPAAAVRGRTEQVVAPVAEPSPPLQQKAFVRECIKQDDCEAPLVCVARGPRELRCEPFEGATPPPRTGPGGRPVPPLRLLDGAAVRSAMGIAP